MGTFYQKDVFWKYPLAQQNIMEFQGSDILKYSCLPKTVSMIGHISFRRSIKSFLPGPTISQ